MGVRTIRSEDTRRRTEPREVRMEEKHKDTLRHTYSEVCANFRAIDEFRGKLLALLPLASGAAGILLLTNRVSTQYLWQIGIFGIVVTLALFVYELRGMLRCGVLIEKAGRLEELLEVDEKARQFSGERHRWLFGIISVPVASTLIYLAVAVGWVFVMGVGFCWWD